LGLLSAAFKEMMPAAAAKPPKACIYSDEGGHPPAFKGLKGPFTGAGDLIS
jgi:hypothetical protein